MESRVLITRAQHTGKSRRPHQGHYGGGCHKRDPGSNGPVRMPTPAMRHRQVLPRPSIATVGIRNGHESARNAGAMASADAPPPRSPSRPSATHYQGNGASPLSIATNGLSTLDASAAARLMLFHLITRASVTG